MVEKEVYTDFRTYLYPRLQLVSGEFLNMENASKLLVDIVVAIVAAIATGIVTSWLYWRQAKADLEKEYLKKFNEKKWVVYTEFTSLLQDLLSDKETDFPELERHVSNETALASQIVLIGSDEVVKAFHAWRETSRVYGKTQKETREKLFILVATMRNDLGIKYSKLEINDLLGALEPGSAKF
jgi:hypothetical protein